MTSAEITALRAALGQSLGLGSWLRAFDGSAAAVADLSVADRQRLYAAVVTWAAANPGKLSAVQVQAAQNLAAMDGATPYGVGDALGDFFSEVGNQAADLNQTLNPFSERNRGYVLGAVALGLVLYFAGPPIIAALKKKAAK